MTQQEVIADLLELLKWLNRKERSPQQIIGKLQDLTEEIQEEIPKTE